MEARCCDGLGRDTDRAQQRWPQLAYSCAARRARGAGGRAGCWFGRLCVKRANRGEDRKDPVHDRAQVARRIETG